MIAMRIIEADVVWTPARRDDGPGAGAIRVERHGSHWQRTSGDFWMPAASLGAYGEVSTKRSSVKQLLGMFTILATLAGRTISARILHPTEPLAPHGQIQRTVDQTEDDPSAHETLPLAKRDEEGRSPVQPAQPWTG